MSVVAVALAAEPGEDRTAIRLCPKSLDGML